MKDRNIEKKKIIKYQKIKFYGHGQPNISYEQNNTSMKSAASKYKWHVNSIHRDWYRVARNSRNKKKQESEFVIFYISVGIMRLNKAFCSGKLVKDWS